MATITTTTTAFTSVEKQPAKTSSYAPMKRVGFVTPRELFIFNLCYFLSLYVHISRLISNVLHQFLLNIAPSFNRNRCTNGVCMSSDPKADGTVYDDEPMLEPERDPLSNTMKERLIREASTGLDSDKPQTNVIAIIGVVVAILVAVGGKDILF